MTDKTVWKVYCVWPVLCLDSRRKTECSEIDDSEHSRNFICSWFLPKLITNIEHSTILEGCISYPCVIILSIILMVYLIGQSIVCCYGHVLGRRFQVHWLLHILLISTLNNFTFCSHKVLMCFRGSQNKPVQHQLIDFVTEKECVYWAVQTEYLYII